MILLPKHELQAVVRQVSQWTVHALLNLLLLFILKFVHLKLPKQVSAVESDWVFGGQSQFIPLMILLPKHKLQAVVRQVSQWTVHA